MKGILAIEVGCFIGYTTCLLAKNFHHVVTVDNFQGELEKKDINIPTLDVYQEYRLNTHRLNNVETCVGYSDDVWRCKLVEKYYGQADFVFIDACHRYPVAVFDIMLYSLLLKRGGILAVHDTRMYYRKPEQQSGKAVAHTVYGGHFYDIGYVDSITYAKFGRHGGLKNRVSQVVRFFDNLKHFILYEWGLYFKVKKIWSEICHSID